MDQSNKEIYSSVRSQEWICFQNGDELVENGDGYQTEPYPSVWSAASGRKREKWALRIIMGEMQHFVML